MKINHPGLIKERLPSGNCRFRVRVLCRKNKRITLPVSPDHPGFTEYYNAARNGLKLPAPEDDVKARYPSGTLGKLLHSYIDHGAGLVDKGVLSPKTQKKRLLVLKPILEQFAMMSVTMPPQAVIKIRDEKAATPSLANAAISELARVFDFGIERGLCVNNPARRIKHLTERNEGAKPWTNFQIQQYFEQHTIGTSAHLALTILLHTACRIGDLRVLGAHNEEFFEGTPSLRWHPQKKNAGAVRIPMPPPLVDALEASGRRQEHPYMVKPDGSPYLTADALGIRFRKWCKQAGVHGYSAHGVRKGVGSFLADAGCSQYEIMAIHGHSQPQTSARYTKGANRWTLANSALKKLSKN